MRQKKTILCVAVEEEKRGRIAFVLEIWGFDVIRADCADSARGFLRGMPEDSVDLILLYAPLPEATGVTLYARTIHPEIRTLAVGFSFRDSPAEVCLPSPSPAELLERIKVLVARKRGPKKKPAGSETAAGANRRLMA